MKKSEQLNSCMSLVLDYDEPLTSKKMHSSSAHIYLNDLYQGLKNGVFVKKDANSNKITVVKSINLKDFLKGDIISEDPIIDVFAKFNKEFNFNKWLKADTCIKEMLDNDWYQAKGTEWPGWFLEFKVDEFINKHNYASIVLYVGNKNKKNGLLDFDLYFPLLNFYGDLKSSDDSKKQAPGNDQFNTLDAISKYGRIWYIIYEHNTIKDKDQNNEMAIARMKLIDPNFRDGDHIAYMSRMKHSVNFRRMYIFELNQINMHTVLSDFNQGHNSGISQKERVAKFLLNKEN